MTTASRTQDPAICTSAMPPCPTQRLAGWISAGLLDWPGRVSATIFLEGCQLRCPYCHNPSLATVSGAKNHVWDEFMGYLQRRRSWIDGIVISGGEPTTDPNLHALLEFFASQGLPVKLDTNGMDPDLLSSLIRRRLIDFIALDIKTLPVDYGCVSASEDAAENLKRSIDIVKRCGLPHEFRTTCYPDVISLDSLSPIARMLEGGAKYVLQQFRPDVTLIENASLCEPYSSTALLEAAAECNTWIPTSTRGV